MIVAHFKEMLFVYYLLQHPQLCWKILSQRNGQLRASNINQ